MCRGEYWNMTAFHDSLAHVCFESFAIERAMGKWNVKTFQNMMSDSKSQYTQTLHAIYL